MSLRPNLDMDVLRTFVTGFEFGSFAKAADRLGRSPSAISAQLRKLEEQVGQALVQKSGRGLVLTTAGENLFGYAKRILELNDEAVDMLRDAAVEGWVRLGLPQDFAESLLPAVLGRFARGHPKVRVEVRVERSGELARLTEKGDLDLALAWGEEASGSYAERVAEVQLVWIARPDWRGVAGLAGEPLPLVAFEPPCLFRAAGTAALDQAGIAWRLAFTSPGLSGLWAAAEAGLGVTLRTRIGLPQSLYALEPAAVGLPPLPHLALSLYKAEAEPLAAVKRLSEILRDKITEETTRLSPRITAIAS